MLSGGGASPTAIGRFEYGTGVAVRTTAIMSRSDIQERRSKRVLLTSSIGGGILHQERPLQYLKVMLYIYIVFSNIRGPANGAIALGNLTFLDFYERTIRMESPKLAGGDIFYPYFRKLLSKCLLADITFKPMPSIAYRLL
ncbi:hypothetical protein V6N12_057934 [Hibiscus sabdariffa]|uniref:Uncharacterized protein n=1 Tax=Hibiscus sabdariffa TaxID=183260 RepID=A0ABR2AEB8_9ROSI